MSEDDKTLAQFEAIDKALGIEPPDVTAFVHTHRLIEDVENYMGKPISASSMYLMRRLELLIQEEVDKQANED